MRAVGPGPKTAAERTWPDQAPRFVKYPAHDGQLMESFEMKIATKLGLLFAGMIIVFILLGVTLLAQMKTVSNGYDALLASPVHDINSGRVDQVNFKKKVQEWKDTLLRGHNPEDLAKYSKQ